MRYTIFGESHGAAIGVVLEGVPAGLKLDMDFIRAQLARRAPGRSPTATARREDDVPEILSGVMDGVATGAPLCAIIRNGDTHSADYEYMKNLPRPSHSDYAAHVKYGGHNDYRGGGHFSGRLTAPLTFAGAVAQLVLAPLGVEISTQIAVLGGEENPTEERVEEIILSAKADGDSVGGAVRCTVTGLRAGLGAPDFGENIEGEIARAMFAIPAVKGVSFGAGFDFAKLRGSAANDPITVENGAILTVKNDSGGVNGGISNGMPVVFTVAFRPTPSIALAQDTVDLNTLEPAKLIIKGRHDPCIVPRALPVVEAAAAIALVDIIERG